MKKIDKTKNQETNLQQKAIKGAKKLLTDFPDLLPRIKEEEDKPHETKSGYCCTCDQALDDIKKLLKLKGE